MNKQTRGDYGNAPNTLVPSVTLPPLKKGKQVQVPSPSPTPHPFKKNKL